MLQDLRSVSLIVSLTFTFSELLSKPETSELRSLPAIDLMSLSTSIPFFFSAPRTPFSEVIGARRLDTTCAMPLPSMKYATLGSTFVSVSTGAFANSSTNPRSGLRMSITKLSFALL